MAKKDDIPKIKNSARPTYDVPVRRIMGNTNPRNPLSSSLQNQGWDCLKGEKQIWLLGVSDDAADRAKFVKLLEDFDPDIISLAATIRSLGLLEPVEVRESGTHTYTLSFGSRRCLATLYNWCILGKPKEPMIQAFLVKGNESAMLIRGAVENIRKEQSVIDQARVIAENVNIGVDKEEIAQGFGISLSTLESRLSLLELPPAEQKAIHEGRKSVKAAKAELAEANGKPSEPAKPPLRKRKEIEAAAEEYSPGTKERNVLDFVLGLREKIS